MQAKNYFAQVEREVPRLVAAMRIGGDNLDAGLTERLLTFMQRSVHFTMPDNGRILNDDLRAIEGLPIRLPFPDITLEYYVERNERLLQGDANIYVPKRVIYAMERSKAEMEHFFNASLGKEDSERLILVMAFNYIEGNWMPLPAGFLMGCSTWEGGDDIVPVDTIPAPEGTYGDKKIAGKTLPMFPEFYGRVEKMYGKEIALTHTSHDIAIEVSALLEFLEALACSNVEISTLQEAHPRNERRIRDGKLPLYETKVLTVRPRHASGKAGTTFDSRSSPREHLRRGHVRRYASGERIWINSVVVNAGTQAGKIDKSYRIKA
jgi:hypothetical protein